VFNNRFAVKELKQKDEMRMEKEEVHFWKEVDMLKKFSGAFNDLVHRRPTLLSFPLGTLRLGLVLVGREEMVRR
jgi:hypothetical protein